MHGINNGFGAPAFGAALANMATRFAENLAPSGVPAAQIPAIRVTAISLPEGGLFDFSSEWSPPYVSHRFGYEADIGMAGLTPAHKKALADAVQLSPLGMPVWSESPSNTAANHWHVARQ
jgi:hypothetical protein